MSPRRDKYEALRVPCPRCGVYEWRACRGSRDQERRALHVERHAAAKQASAPESKKDPKGYNRTWARKRAQVFALKGNKCEYCGQDASDVDHQTPRARGGSDDISNLVPCCAVCNRAKGMMTLEEWRV